MEQESSCVYGLKQQARSLACQLAESERNRFFVGTYGVRQDNEIHLLDFDEDEFEISSQIYKHPDEIWSMSPSPSSTDLLFTTHSSPASSRTATLWRLDSIESDESGKLKSQSGTLEPVINVLWNATGASDKVVALTNTNITVFAIDVPSKSAQSSQTIASPPTRKEQDRKINAGAWNPHQNDSIAIAADSSVHTYDLRSRTASTPSLTIDHAHHVSVKDVDYNPNKPYQIATGGDDCVVRVWDTRDVKVPLKEIVGHSHWIWNVTYNRFHDQLLLSSSSDCTVLLHSLVSISSAPFGHDDDVEESPRDGAETPPSDQDDDESQGKPTDGLVATYDQHEDSVYSVAWSSGDPWIFASLSYDGRVVVNMVPRAHKYKIILI
ncbi:hypothetical protein SmJEL517_g00904 [Synchytrium microbalum]|uniref:EIPR1-like beta-propeller domain-containing protein n=1 Tax=Synchytrium microbalum TaxID=1806994 RepID=A0A507CGJ6_9FUNG|nr:uncharacterized protein SmJEL517_g00904 [Synchytrium microbalum]TPX37104.1 hypothetical protein SmJEL517_g00904 [Synchytrium microbalum]